VAQKLAANFEFAGLSRVSESSYYSSEDGQETPNDFRAPGRNVNVDALQRT
jgi:hypothetical protein